MKILILGFAKIKYMPYLNFYLDNIDVQSNDVHLVYWNRDCADEDLSHLSDITLHELRLYQEDDVSPIRKVKGFVQYRRFAKKVSAQGFDFVITLHTFPGVLMADSLIRHYQNRFIVDYRDKTYEHIPAFKKLMHRLVHASCAAFVSSDAYRELLPESAQGKIYTSHNLMLEDVNARNRIDASDVLSNRIRIGFWGILRNEELNREIIRKVAKDDRFELHYYGREQRTALNLKSYAVSLNTDRVFFHGEYTAPDRHDFAARTELLHNVYLDDNMMLAMANKYYDGIIFRIPQLCMKGSFMGKCAESACVGYLCDPREEDFLDGIYTYFQTLDREKFRKNCEQELQRVLEEYTRGCRFIKDITTDADIP